MMEAKEKAIDNDAKNDFVLDESVDLRRKKIGIQMMKLRLILFLSENPTKSDLEWMRTLNKMYQNFGSRNC